MRGKRERERGRRKKGTFYDRAIRERVRPPKEYFKFNPDATVIKHDGVAKGRGEDSKGGWSKGG